MPSAQNSSDSPSQSASSEARKRLSNIGRPVDPRYPTNLAIAVLSLLVLVIAAGMRFAAGAALPAALGYGVLASLATFLAWALGREIDPDHNGSALLAAPLAAVAYLAFGVIAVIALYAALVTLRVLARTVGFAPTRVDLTLVAFGAGLVAYVGSPLVALGLATALLLDARLPEGSGRAGYRAAAAGFGAVIGVMMHLWPLRVIWSFDAVLLIAGVVIAVLYLAVVLMMPKTMSSVDDQRGQPLHYTRVFAAQLVALALVAGAFAWEGTRGIAKFAPLWATFAGVVLWWGWQRVAGGARGKA